MRSNLESRAEKLYSCIERTRGLELLVKKKEWRSPTIIAIEVEGGSKNLQQELLSRAIHVGLGFDQKEDQILRIANFFSHTDEDIEFLIDNVKDLL